jgi:hypothetical protein
LNDVPLKLCPCGRPSRGGSNRSRYCVTCYADRYKHVPCPFCGSPMDFSSTKCVRCRYGPPVTPRDVRPIDVAWLAGILEGEGSFISKGRPRIQVAMTDQDIIARLSELTGVGRVYAVSRQKPHHKDAWLWTVNRPAHLEHIIRLVLPWLGQRRALAAKDVLRKISSTPAP